MINSGPALAGFFFIFSRTPDTTNGITDFFARRVHTQEICTKKSDGTEVCASGDQLAAILSGSAAAGAPARAPATMPGAAGNATSGPPTISINGDNPATLQIGVTMT
jgi:hypothetical protein